MDQGKRGGAAPSRRCRGEGLSTPSEISAVHAQHVGWNWTSSTIPTFSFLGECTLCCTAMVPDSTGGETAAAKAALFTGGVSPCSGVNESQFNLGSFMIFLRGKMSMANFANCFLWLVCWVPTMKAWGLGVQPQKSTDKLLGDLAQERL